MAEKKQMKKLSFGFTTEDMRELEKWKKLLLPTLGRVTNIQAIRAALRKANAAQEGQ